MSEKPVRATPLLALLATAVVAGTCGWMLAHLQSRSAAAGATPMAEAPAAPVATEPMAAASSRPEQPVFPQYGTTNGTAAGTVIAALTSADGDVRMAGIETALANDIELPPGTLVDVYESPGDEALRQLAFERHIDSLASDVETARAALQSATASDSPAVRSEAYRRLDQLTAYEANVAETEVFLRSRMNSKNGSGEPPLR